MRKASGKRDRSNSLSYRKGPSVAVSISTCGPAQGFSSGVRAAGKKGDRTCDGRGPVPFFFRPLLTGRFDLRGFQVLNIRQTSRREADRKQAPVSRTPRL